MTLTTAQFGNGLSPSQILIDSLEDNNESPYDIVVIVALRDDIISSAWSDGSALVRLGMLSKASQNILETFKEE